MYNTILVPLDGSKKAEKILPHIEEMARRFEARTILIQVIEPHIQFSGSEVAHQDEAIEEFKRETQQAETYLATLESTLEREALHVQRQVPYGEVVKSILRIARGANVDLIAMASHGRSGFSRVFYGSVAAGMLHQVDRPLLVIRAESGQESGGKELNMYTTILIPLDGSKRAERILPHAQELARRMDSKLVLLRVVELVYDVVGPHGTIMDVTRDLMEKREEEARNYISGLEGELRELGHKVKGVMDRGPVVSAIIDVANRENADLIAMASHGRTGLARVFYGSVAAGVLHQVDRPLLVIRAEGRE